jgi:hypothetical protein
MGTILVVIVLQDKNHYFFPLATERKYLPKAGKELQVVVKLLRRG